MPGLHVALGGWQSLAAEATPIRFAVFVAEQGVPEDLEIDESDAGALHAVARDATGRAVGTGRLLGDGRIGRMAVLRHARGLGIGSAILEALMEAARTRGLPEAYLSAQIPAMSFYARHGYVAEGEPYDDAGLAHITMRCRLQRAPSPAPG